MARLSDTAQTLAVVAAFADGPTRVTGHRVHPRQGDRPHRRRRHRAAAPRRRRRGGARRLHRPPRPDARRRPSRPTTTTAWRWRSRSPACASPGVQIADPGCVAKTFPGYWRPPRRAAEPRGRRHYGPARMRVIAIDGPAGSGKSTVARALAERLGLEYLDTGAMYRSVTFAALRRGIDPVRGRAGRRASSATSSSRSGADGVTVDGVDATIEIRGPEVSRAVSIVAANPAVRTEMVRRQREWVGGHGRRGARGPRHRHRGVPRRRAQGVPDRRSRGAGPAALARRSPTSTTRRSPPTSPAATRSTRAARCRRSPRPTDAFLVDTTGLSVEEIIDAIAELGTDDRWLRPDPATTSRSGPGAPTPRHPDLLRHRPRPDPRWWPSCSAGSTVVGAEKVPTDGRLRPGARCTAATSTSPSPPSSPRGRCATWARTRSGSRSRSAGSCRCSAPSRCTAAAPTATPCKACTDIVNGGSPLVMFPEGTRCTGPVVRGAVRRHRLRGRQGRRADHPGGHRRAARR